MVQSKANRSLLWPKGDTYTFRVTMSGLDMASGDYLLFAICDGETYETVYSQSSPFVMNEAVIEVPSSATSVLEAGEYYYDLRILRGVEIVQDSVVVSKEDKVWSVFSPKLPGLTITEVARNV